MPDIEDDIKSDNEDIADQRRLSNADLDRDEHITEGINVITDIADEEDTKSICENSLFNGHEATLHGLLTQDMLREFFQPVIVIYLKQSKMRLLQF